MKLNLGCGTDIRAGYVNVDRLEYPGVDVILNLDDDDGWPDDWAQLEHVVMQDVLEHLDKPRLVLALLCHRLADGGAIDIRGPHYTCRDTWTDDTHRRGLSSEFVPRCLPGGIDVRVRIGFEWWNRWMTWINWLGPRGLKLYEATFLCALAPAKYVHARITQR